MKKLVRRVVCGIVAAATFALSGCSQLTEFLGNLANENAEETTFFEGEFKEVSVEEIEKFLATAGKVSMEELIKNNSGVKYKKVQTEGAVDNGIQYSSIQETTLLIMSAEERMKVDLEIKVEPEHPEITAGTESIYFDGGYSYRYQEYYDSDAKKEVKEKYKYKEERSFTKLIRGMWGDTGEDFVIEDILENIHRRGKESKFYMEFSTDGYKIKATTILYDTSCTYVWVYDRDKNLLGYSTNEEGSLNDIAVTWINFAMPWSGTITPPSDLSSYPLKGAK